MKLFGSGANTGIMIQKILEWISIRNFLQGAPAESLG